MDLEKFINSMRPEIVKSVQEVVRIKSIKDTPKPGAPFGEGINNALNYVLKLAVSMGFKTKNINGYMGYAEYGDGDEIVGVLGHLDVVPEGSGWLFPPYEAHIKDNKIFGRGTVDDKGPIIAALYGLKAIKDGEFSLNKRVRIIFGTDEEGEWQDIEEYLKNDVPLDTGFTPDGMFPVINAEKGSINLEFKKEIVRKSKGMISIKELKGGDAVSIVPNQCTCELKLKDMAKLMLKDTLDLYSEKNNINMFMQEEGEVEFITSRGLSCHSSLPDNGKNAITQLIVFLSQFNLGQSDVSDFIRFLSRYIGNESSGKALNIDCKDDISGELTVNLGQISIDENRAFAVINIRYPVNASYENIIENILQIASDKKVDVSVLRHKLPLYIENDSKLITTLIDSYKSITGKDGYTIAIGGQTYAKAFKNMAAFGPIFPGEEKCAHMPNEFIDIDNLIQCAKIYSKAIYELSKLFLPMRKINFNMGSYTLSQTRK